MKPPLERNPTKKRHSWWWDSHISPKNSKWLAENLEEMDKQVKEMLQLIEEDGDSFAKKAQMYYQRRPMLITHVENFYCMYRALAERYDNVTGELRKNIPTRLQSTGSLTSSEYGSELQRSPSPSPEPLQRSWTREQSPRAAGFDFFLNNRNNDSPSSRKEPEDLASQSESDAKSEDGEDDGIAYTLHQRVLELEDELNMTNQKLQDANEKLQVLEEKSLRCHCNSKENGNGAEQTTELEAQIVNLQEQVDSARRQFEEALSESDGEISRLKQELADASEKLQQEKYANDLQVSELQQSVEYIRSKLEKVSEEKLLVENKVKELEARNAEADKYGHELTQAAEKLSEEKFRHEAEILTMRQNIEDLKSEIIKLQEIIKDLQARLENDSNEKGVLEERAMEFEQVRRQLEDSRAEVRELQTTVKNLKDDLEKALQEKAELQNRMKDVEQATSDLNSMVASLEGKLTATDAQLEQLHVEKAEAIHERENFLAQLIQEIAQLKTEIQLLSSEKDEVENKVSVLLIDVTTRDEKLKEMENHLHQLHLEHVKLIEEADAARKDVSGLRSRVRELEKEVEKQKLVISDSAEGKREAIRQLCFSLDHYRHGYQHLRQLLQDRKRPLVMAT